MLKRRAISALKLARGLTLAFANAPDCIGRMYRGTDKVEHGYLGFYRRHFAAIRFRSLVVYEIGVGGVEKRTPGGSLPLWRDYFPRSTIVGIDLYEKDVTFGPRVKFERADQSSEAELARVVARNGRPHVVIDDGSHVGNHICISFETLWPHLLPGGCYVIEDLATSYIRSYGGAVPPPSRSGVGLVQALINEAQSRDPATEHRAGVSDVESVHCYPGIAFVRKAKALSGEKSGK